MSACITAGQYKYHTTHIIIDILGTSDIKTFLSFKTHNPSKIKP